MQGWNRFDDEGCATADVDGNEDVFKAPIYNLQPPFDSRGIAMIGHNGPPKAGNWIAISRDMIEHHIVGAGRRVEPADKNQDNCYNRMEAWIDLLGMANFAERSVDIKGASLILTPGQTLAGRAYLAKRWNWTEKTVRGFLERLERELMITLACEALKLSTRPGSNRAELGQKTGHPKGHLPNVLTICNWSKYQGSPQEQGPPNGPPKGQPRASQGPHYNKETIKQDYYIPNAGAGATAEKVAGTAPEISFDILAEKLIGACNGALDNPANCQGLASLAIPMMWLNNGCDLDADIIPTLQGYGKSAHGKQIKTWNYFTGGVQKARDARLTGMAAPSAASAKSSPKAESQAEKYKRLFQKIESEKGPRNV